MLTPQTLITMGLIKSLFKLLAWVISSNSLKKFELDGVFMEFFHSLNKQKILLLITSIHSFQLQYTDKISFHINSPNFKSNKTLKTLEIYISVDVSQSPSMPMKQPVSMAGCRLDRHLWPLKAWQAWWFQLCNTLIKLRSNWSDSIRSLIEVIQQLLEREPKFYNFYIR